MKLAHIALSPASLCLGGVLLVDEDHVVLEVTSGSPNRLVVINAPDLLRTWKCCRISCSDAERSR
jgi:hypothetical protein